MNIPLDLEGRSAETARSQSRFGAFFGSKGFVASLKAASRSLSHAGTALLVLSLIGLNATGLDQTLQSQQVHWHDLRVELNQEAVRSSFDKLLKDNPPQDVADEEDKQDQKDIVNYLARSFETSLARSDVWRDAQRDDDKHVDPFIRSFVVKNQILTEVHSSTSEAYSRRWKNNDGPPPSDPPGGGGNDRPSGGGGNDRPSGGSPGSAPNDRPHPSPSSGGSGPSPAGEPIPEPKPEPIPGPQTSAGIEFAKDLKETLAKRPTLWQRVKTKFRSQISKLSQPATVADVSETVVSELLGAFAEKGLGADTEVGKLISKVAKSTVKSSSKEAYKVISQRLMNDLAGDTNLDEAFRKVENLNDKDFPILKTAQVTSFKGAAESVVQSKEYASYVKEHPRALADSPADTVDFKRGVERFKASYDGDRRGIQNEFNAFALYDDIYAGQKNSPESVKSKLVAELSPDTKTEGRNIQADSVRSRSFADLVGHSNTGGVLIGRAPDESSRAMGFVDLHWVPRDNELLLILKRKDGKEFTLGPYKSSLVHQALAYVADGRTAAVTILNIKDRYQKIFLHPAFLDTQLGQDVIELDQYVFKVMKGNVRYEEAEKRVDAQEMLYLVAWLSRHLAFYLESMRRIESRLATDRMLQDFGQNKAAEIEQLSNDQREVAEKISMFQTELSNTERNKLASQALVDSGPLLNPDRSILAYKKEFYDQEFVEEIKYCADREKDLIDFNSCIQDVTIYAMKEATPEKIKRWSAPPPSIQPLSGVRETSFTVDSDLNFLKPSTTSGQLWPLDFTILHAFSSRPEFLPAGENADAYADRNPWQFFELNDEIASRVWQKIDSDLRSKSSYQDLRDFTVLQRLFRFALDGNVWSEFPIGKLVDLTRATAESYEFVPTARWNHPEYGSRKPELFAP